MLTATVNNHGKKYEQIDPVFTRKVRDHFYVDDLNTGVKMSEEGLTLYKNMKSRFMEGNFNLRKWRTNDDSLRSAISLNESVIYNEKVPNMRNEKVLGIPWDEIKDVFILKIDEIFKEAAAITPTKRNILKIIASVFDPVGFLQPLTIKLKILFQQICVAGIGWDVVVENVLLDKWLILVDLFTKIKEIVIPRCYFDGIYDNVIKISLHGFGDSSLDAYGACIYIRIEKKSGEVVVRLVTSKSRVVPLKKKYSIPRLELLASFILSKLMVKVKQVLEQELFINDCYCWSDSMIVLAWILAEHKELKTFVQNRVIQIRNNIDSKKWHYCRSAENPADIITRFKECDIENNKLWWHGPLFIHKDINIENLSMHNDHIKVENGDSLDYNQDIFNSEVFEKAVSLHVLEKELFCIGNIMDVNKYSKLKKLLRITGWVRRFINNIRNKIKKKELNKKNYLIAEELKEALILWVKDNQIVLFNSSKFESIKKNLVLEKVNDVYRSMGRLLNSKFGYDAKVPIMLSTEHKLAELIVFDVHENIKHNGVKNTIAELRMKFWISKARSFAKKVLSNCVSCHRYNSRAYKYPENSNLPAERLTEDVTFSCTGVDYFGPLFYKSNLCNDPDELVKCFISLYTCASTRGVILSVVPDASAKSFINSLRSFIARRGCPKIMISDNGKVFTADITQIFAADHGIQWKFNVAYAPWQGGFWERIVSSVKRCIKKSINKSILTFTEIETLLCEIESVLNNRPLCTYEEEDWDEMISPNLLLYGRKLQSINHDVKNINLDYLENKVISKRVKFIDGVINDYWERWRREYVLALRQHQRTKKQSSAQTPNTNDIVLVYEEKQPRQQWKVGRILELITSNDGEIRQANVIVRKTKRVINRPINRLYPLEKHLDKVNEQKELTVERVNIKPKRNAAIIGEIKRRFMSE